MKSIIKAQIAVFSLCLLGGLNASLAGDEPRFCSEAWEFVAQGQEALEIWRDLEDQGLKTTSRSYGMPDGWSHLSIGAHKKGTSCEVDVQEDQTLEDVVDIIYCHEYSLSC